MRALLASLLLLTSVLCHAQVPAIDQAWPGKAATELSGPEFLPVEEAYQLDIDIENDRSIATKVSNRNLSQLFEYPEVRA